MASLLTAPIATLESGTIVDTHWVVLGAMKDLKFSGNNLWTGASKELRVTVNLDNLSMFTFGGATNVSHWLDRQELEVNYTHTIPAT